MLELEVVVGMEDGAYTNSCVERMYNLSVIFCVCRYAML